MASRCKDKLSKCLDVLIGDLKNAQDGVSLIKSKLDSGDISPSGIADLYMTLSGLVEDFSQEIGEFLGGNQASPSSEALPASLRSSETLAKAAKCYKESHSTAEDSKLTEIFDRLVSLEQHQVATSVFQSESRMAQHELNKQVAELECHLEQRVSAMKERIDKNLNSLQTGTNENIKKLLNHREEQQAQLDTLVVWMEQKELATGWERVIFKAKLNTEKEIATSLFCSTPLDQTVEVVLNEGGGQLSNGKYKLPLDGTYVAILDAQQDHPGELVVVVLLNGNGSGMGLRTTGVFHTGTSVAVLDLKRGDELWLEAEARGGKPRIFCCYLNVFRIA